MRACTALHCVAAPSIRKQQNAIAASPTSGPLGRASIGAPASRGSSTSHSVASRPPTSPAAATALKCAPTLTPAAAAAVPSSAPPSTPKLCPACSLDMTGCRARRSSSTPCTFMATSLRLTATVVTASAAVSTARLGAQPTATVPAG